MVRLKKILLAVSVLLTISVTTVEAQEKISDNLQEETEKGSVQIILTGEEDAKKEGVKFQCVKVADILNGEYILAEKFQESGIDLSVVHTADKLDEAARRLSEQHFDEESEKTDSSGVVIFSELETGLYLLKAVDPSSDDKISPTLIAIPTWNETEKKMEYHVSVFPKHTTKQTATVKTGDFENVHKYILLMGLSLLGICCLGRRKGRHV